MDWIRIAKTNAAPVMVHGQKITWQNLAVQVWVPGKKGGAIYNRPFRVTVEHPDGQTESHLIFNYTRLACGLVMGLGLLSVFSMISRRKA